jgi:hypothetical protein
MECVFDGGRLGAMFHRELSNSQMMVLKRIDVRVWRGTEEEV